MNLEKKVAIVTGVSPDSIGEAYARALSREGAQVVCADLRTELAEEVAKGLANDGGVAEGLHVDVGDEDSVADLVRQSLERFGGVDILVNNAGIMRPDIVAREFEALGGSTLAGGPGGLIDMPLDYFHRFMDVTGWGCLICSRAVVPSMKERGGGRIVNQSSSAAYMTLAGLYGLSKLAVLGVTRALAAELGQYNITVNGIAPGPTDTDALRSGGEGTEAAVQALLAQMPIKRRGRPSDQANALLFLVSPDSGFITGHTLLVDGGQVMRL